MNITFLILAHGEISALDLIDYLNRHRDTDSEIVVLNDPTIPQYENELKIRGAIVVNHKLEHSYSEHRNFALPHCNGDWIFALDADEIPQKYLLCNLKPILEQAQADVLWLPRLNIFQGVTPKDIAQYGWNYKDGLINWPDYQSRLFKNNRGLVWHGNLHERILATEQHTEFKLKDDAAFSIVHRKTIEQQRLSNQRYNQAYSENENKGLIDG